MQENSRSKVIPVKLKLCLFNHISPLPFSSFPDPPAWLYFLHKINFPLVVCLPTNKSDCLWITHCALQVLMIFLIDVSQVIGGGGGGMCPQCPHGSYTYDTHMHVHRCESVLVPCTDQVYWPSLPQHPYMIIHCSAYATEHIVLSQQFFYAAHRSTQILLCMHRYHGTYCMVPCTLQCHSQIRCCSIAPANPFQSEDMHKLEVPAPPFYPRYAK